ncbi:MAG TPA: TetR/AcrR family transcriptional regulator [Roseiflexaceae bacterium]|nr:TetR/AcrR family transcriptional regulator [Roseiflexaceae bacterium]
MNRRQRQKAATAQRIFEVAVELFERQGYEATTVEAITSAAGIAKGTFFTHFPTKEAVLGHLGLMQMQRLEAAVAAAPGFSALDTREQIRFLFRVLAGGVEERRELARLVAVETLRRRGALPNHDQSFAEFERLLAQVAGEGQARGELRGDVPAAELAGLLRGIYMSALAVWLEQEARPPAAILDLYLDLLLDGLRPRAPQEQPAHDTRITP